MQRVIYCARLSLMHRGNAGCKLQWSVAGAINPSYLADSNDFSTNYP
jgi:hypothetical protein